MPWENGNSALAGHRDTFFRPLKDVRAGDEIRLALGFPVDRVAAQSLPTRLATCRFSDSSGGRVAAYVRADALGLLRVRFYMGEVMTVAAAGVTSMTLGHVG